MVATVYLVTNRINGKRYIGVTSRKPSERRYFHERHALHGKRAQCRYFHAALRKYGLDAFEWTVLLECPSFEEGLREEIRLISEIRPEYNLTRGGQGVVGRVATLEQRAAISARMKGKKPTPEMIAKASAKNRGRKRTPEQRERMGAARRGKPFSEAHLRNMSIAKTGKKQSRETVAKRTYWIGRTLSPEHRAKISASLMGHPGNGRGKKKDPESIRRGWETRRKNQETARVAD